MGHGLSLHSLSSLNLQLCPRTGQLSHQQPNTLKSTQKKKGVEEKKNMDYKAITPKPIAIS
jgi:hypothetical protein